MRLAILFAAALAACAPKATTESPPASASPSSSPAPPPEPAATQGLAPPPSDAGAEAAAPPSPSPPPPPANVKLVTIGMHVAGGPFDEPTKEPFKRAVEPHFSEMLQCWAASPPPAPAPKSADVGVDLMIEAAGGKPKVTNPRINIAGVKATDSELVRCIVGVFETVEFPKLDRGRTGVSYSLRFTVKP